jgi:hypothetical protein
MDTLDVLLDAVEDGRPGWRDLVAGIRPGDWGTQTPSGFFYLTAPQGLT